MSKKLKVILTISGVTVLTGGVAAGAAIFLPKLIKKHADLGMTKAEVLKRLGDPDHTSESGDYWYYFENKVGKKYKEKDELEHTWNEANQIKAQSIGLELETEHFESKTIHFNEDNIVISYFYNTDTKYTYESEKFSSWSEKNSTEITTDFPSEMKCYINSVNKDGINHYLIEDDNFKNTFNYEAMFEDKSLIKFANETFFDVVGPKNNINVEWKYDDLKLSTKINFKVYDARVVATAEAKNVYISGNGLYNIGDNVELRAEISPGYINKGWDTDVSYSFGTRTATHLTDDTDYSFKIQDYGKKEFEFLAEIENYTITYNLHGGINSSSNPSSYNVENNVTFASPSKNGCTFLGWYDTNENKITSIPPGTTGNLILDARWEINNYHITYNLDGGTNNPSNPFSYNIESNITFESPTKTGYTFLGWYDSNGNKITSISPGRTGAISLTAYWEVISYSITYNLNGGTNSASNPTSYTVESSTLNLENATRMGYTFLGWFDNDGNAISSIDRGTSGDLILNAHWNGGDSYVITLDANEGTVSQTSLNVQYDHSYSLPTPTKDGYSFNGWYDGSIKVNNTGTWEYTSNKTFVAQWTIINFEINYELNGGTNNPANPTSYTVEDALDFAVPSKTGYSFQGWFNGDSPVTRINEGSTGTVNIEARWTANLNILSVLSDDTSKGTVSISSGTGYSDESVTVVATPTGDCVFKGWYHGSTKISDDMTYTFTMPTNDFSLIAHFFSKEEEEEEIYAKKYGSRPILSDDGKTITYGLYPQKNVNDSALVSALNSLTTPESNGWYFYENEYYAKLSATPFNTIYNFDNGVKILAGTTYWFKCEPIVWNVLCNNSGEYYIVSSVLLDCHCYYNSRSSRHVGGQTAYANNYKYSDIRAWLNTDFYDCAFALGNECILTTTVDNSVSTTGITGNKFACDNTEDKVFLPSITDFRNESYGFTGASTRYCRPTDWAKCRGAYYWSESSYDWQYSGDYWTRSPSYNQSNLDNSSKTARIISAAGVLYNNAYVDSTSVCARPGLTIKIN